MTKLSSDVFAPIASFYTRGESPLFEEIAGQELPEPYRNLLNHSRDMTPTLEDHHSTVIHLNIMKSYRDREIYHRQVVLLSEEGEPVEFGAIAIHLTAFQDTPRQRILEGYEPLGAILEEFDIEHECKPVAFFRTQSDLAMMEAFELTDGTTVYGRCTELLEKSGIPLAEVVEVLPPARL